MTEYLSFGEKICTLERGGFCLDCSMIRWFSIYLSGFALRPPMFKTKKCSWQGFGKVSVCQHPAATRKLYHPHHFLLWASTPEHCLSPWFFSIHGIHLNPASSHQGSQGNIVPYCPLTKICLWSLRAKNLTCFCFWRLTRAGYLQKGRSIRRYGRMNMPLMTAISCPLSANWGKRLSQIRNIPFTAPSRNPETLSPSSLFAVSINTGTLLVSLIFFNTWANWGKRLSQIRNIPFTFLQ